MTTETSSDSTFKKLLPALFIYGWIVLLVIIAAFIRVYDANDFYYNADEAMHTSIASGDTMSDVLKFSRFEIHPPLFYVLCHFWMKISAKPAFVRCLPLLLGLLLIPLYYRIGFILSRPLTGITCATLIVFSHGCIIQSYVVRQYILFLLLASLAIYYFLLWRSNRKTKWLLVYTLWGVLAALSHFSAIFLTLCIAAFEMASMCQKREAIKTCLQWIVANAIIGCVAVSVYYLWQPIFVPLHSYFITNNLPPLIALLSTPFYPLAQAAYIFPGLSCSLTFFLLMGLGMFAFPKHPLPHSSVRLSSLIFLCGLAFALGIVLFLTRIYPPLGGRHTIWILPLLIPPTGWMLAVILEWILERALPRFHALHLPIASLLLLIAGFALYDPELRFSDGSEYVWQRGVWDDFSRYMPQFGPTDLIVTEKDDGIMLTNLYPSMSQEDINAKTMAKLVHYRTTHILFNPYYPRNYSKDVFLATLRGAQENHMLDGIKQLVFLRMAWSRSPLADLMLCDALPKQIITFPSFLAEPPLTRDNIVRTRAALMIVSKDSFVEKVLSPTGTARNCLNGAHDLVPGFMPSGFP